MFHKKGKKIFILISLIIIFSAAMFFVGIKMENTAVDNLQENQNDTQAETTEPIINAYIADADNLLLPQQKDVLQNYAKLYAETLVYLEPQDISVLYYDNNSAEYHLNKTAFEVITTVRKMAEKDLTLEFCEVEYTITDAYDYKGKTYILLLENNIQQFRFLDQPSENFIIQHEFVLEQVEEKWYITSHAQEEDFYLLVAEDWVKQKGTPQEIAGIVMADIIADTEENILWRKENYLNKNRGKNCR